MADFTLQLWMYLWTYLGILYHFYSIFLPSVGFLFFPLRVLPYLFWNKEKQEIYSFHFFVASQWNVWNIKTCQSGTIIVHAFQNPESERDEKIHLRCVSEIWKRKYWWFIVINNRWHSYLKQWMKLVSIFSIQNNSNAGIFNKSHLILTDV